MLSWISLTSSLQDLPPFVSYGSKWLRTLWYQNHADLPSVTFALGKFPSIRFFRRFDRGGVYIVVKSRTSRFKISLTAKISGNALDWIKRKPPKSTFKRLFLETKALLILIMSGNAEKPSGRAQGRGMRAGSHYHSAPNPICGPCGSLQETG